MGLAYREHRRVAGPKRTGKHGLQRKDDLCAGHNRVYAFLRHAGMSAAAGDLDLKTVRGRGENAAAHAEAARGQRACEMQTEHLVHTLQHAGADDFHRTAGRGLLRMLKNKAQFPAQLLPPAAQQPHGIQQDSRMPVMAAGVHHAFIAGAIIQLVFLADGQRVDVRTNGEAAAGPSGAQYRHHTGGCRTAEFQPFQFAQRLLQIIRCLVFPEGQLGMPVQPASVLDALRQKLQYLLMQIFHSQRLDFLQ